MNERANEKNLRNKRRNVVNSWSKWRMVGETEKIREIQEVNDDWMREQIKRNWEINGK